MTRGLQHKNGFAALSAMAVTLVMAATLASCDAGQADALTGNGEVMLTLRLSLPGTEEKESTRAITATEENAIDISQLKVLVFQASGSVETFCYEAPQVQLQGGRYIVTLRQSRAGEKYRLSVIANAGRKLPLIPGNISKSDALRMITFDASGSWNTAGSSSYVPIPMWGETASAQTITASTSLGGITLLRALARIDVGCALSGESATGVSGFTMKSVSVYHTKSKGYAVPVDGGAINGNVVTSVSIPPDANTNGTLAYTCTDGKSLIRTIYVAEIPQGTSKDDCVCLVIGGTYGGSTNYYRIDLTSGGAYIPLKRNCRYAVNIKAVTGAGYATEADALKGDKTLIVATSISAETWGSETGAGSGTITLP